MPGEDVIELGSSDDEPGPAAKKVRKPKPNVMVHIPRPHNNQNKKQFPNNLGKIRIVNVESMLKKPTNSPRILNYPRPLNIPRALNYKFPFNGQKMPGLILNPLANKNSKTLTNQKVPIQKVGIAQGSRSVAQNASRKRPIGPNLSAVNRSPSTKCMPSVKCIPSLPPGITVTRTAKPVSPKRSKLIPQKRKQLQTLKNVNKKNYNVGSVLTVELDDDDDDDNGGAPATLTAMPSWYVKPEDGTSATKDNKSNKDQNNAKAKSAVEITIEDSPVKLKKIDSSKQSKKEKELAITIEDSPVNTPNKQKSNDLNSKERNERTPNSKKRLQYPDENILKDNDSRGSVIVEINFNENIESDEENSTHKKDDDFVGEETSQNNVIDVIDLDTPSKTEADIDSGPAKKIPLSNLNNSDEQNDSDIHPVYQSFIDLCLSLENTDDMRNIVERKIMRYYKQLPREYIESEAFVELVSFKMNFIKAHPSELYFQIRDVVDELKFQREQAKARVETTHPAAEENCNEEFFAELDPKRERQVLKLEKTLRKLHIAIQKLEEEEINFDDDADSVYILVDRYKERLVRVHAKLCQLRNIKMPSEPRIHIEPRLGRPMGPIRRLEAWINKKVPVGTPLPFPDFHDVLNCVKFANRDDNLGMSEIEMMEEARDLFIRCGKKLQRRRQENEWRLASSRLTSNVDPAEHSPELKIKLESNRKAAAIKENEIINTYADRQSQLKLEPVEITDKDAQVSSESDDDVEEIIETDDNKSKDDPNDREELPIALADAGETKRTEVFDKYNLLESDGESAISVSSDSSDSDSSDLCVDDKDGNNELQYEDFTTIDDSNSPMVTDIPELNIVVENVFSIDSSEFGMDFKKGISDDNEIDTQYVELDCTESEKALVPSEKVKESITNEKGVNEVENSDLHVINTNVSNALETDLVTENISPKNNLVSNSALRDNEVGKGNSDRNTSVTDALETHLDAEKNISKDNSNYNPVLSGNKVEKKISDSKEIYTQAVKNDCTESEKEITASEKSNGSLTNVDGKNKLGDNDLTVRDASGTNLVVENVHSKDNSDSNPVFNSNNDEKEISVHKKIDTQSVEIDCIESKEIVVSENVNESISNVEGENELGDDLPVINWNVTDAAVNVPSKDNSISKPVLRSNNAEVKEISDNKEIDTQSVQTDCTESEKKIVASENVNESITNVEKDNALGDGELPVINCNVPDSAENVLSKDDSESKAVFRDNNVEKEISDNKENYFLEIGSTELLKEKVATSENINVSMKNPVCQIELGADGLTNINENGIDTSGTDFIVENNSDSDPVLTSNLVKKVITDNKENCLQSSEMDCTESKKEKVSTSVAYVNESIKNVINNNVTDDSGIEEIVTENVHEDSSSFLNILPKVNKTDIPEKLKKSEVLQDSNEIVNPELSIFDNKENGIHNMEIDETVEEDSEAGRNYFIKDLKETSSLVFKEDVTLNSMDTS